MCYDLCPMRCSSDGPIQNNDCPYMGHLHIEHNPSTHMVATLDFSLDFSLFNDVHWPFALILVVEWGGPFRLSIP